MNEKFKNIIKIVRVSVKIISWVADSLQRFPTLEGNNSSETGFDKRAEHPVAENASKPKIKHDNTGDK